MHGKVYVIDLEFEWILMVITQSDSSHTVNDILYYLWQTPDKQNTDFDYFVQFRDIPDITDESYIIIITGDLYKCARIYF